MAMTKPALREAPGIPAQAPEKHTFTYGIGLILSIGSLAAALWGIDLSSTAAAIARANPGFIALAVVSVLLTFAAKTMRWRLLLSVSKKVSFWRAFAVLNIGMLLNTFVPARLGDFARMYFLGESEQESKSYIFGTILLEKISDLLGLLLATGFILLVLPLPNWLLGSVRDLLVTTAVLITGLVIFCWRSDIFIRLLERFGKNRKLRWLSSPLSEALRKFRQLFHPQVSSGVLAWTVIMPVLGASTNYFIFRALNLQLTEWAAVFLLIVLMLGVSVPSSPGRFGVFHYLTVLALSPFGVAKNNAFACGVVLHLAIYLPTVLLGGYYLWREQISLQNIAASFNHWKAITQSR